MFLHGTMSEAAAEAAGLAASQCVNPDDATLLKFVQYDGYLRRWFVHHEPIDFVQWNADPEDYAERLADAVADDNAGFWQAFDRAVSHA